MRVIGVLIALVALLGVAPIDAAATDAVKPKPVNITFGAGPANAQKPDGRTIFTWGGSAGGSFEDHIAVLNITRHPEVLRVYTVDVTPGTDGGFVYEPRSAPRVAAGAWVAVGTPHASGFIHAKPRSTTILPVHLTIPTNASPGDHAAAVIVSLTSLVNGKSGQRVNLEQRVAVRALIRVAGVIRPQLTIEHLHAGYAGRLNPIKGGLVTVKYTVANTGNAILTGTQQISVHGMFGTTTHAKSLPVIPTLLPGGTFAVTAHLPDVFPEIRMTAKVQVTPAGLPGDADPTLSPETATAHFWAIPWILLAIIVVLLLALVWRIRRWRRPRAQAVAPLSTTTPQGVGAP